MKRYKMQMKCKEERRSFIRDYMKQAHVPCVSVVDAAFVDAYIEATNASFWPQAFGAHTCPTLGRDLSAMYRAGILSRSRISLSGQEVGFPGWIYVYELEES